MDNSPIYVKSYSQALEAVTYLNKFNIYGLDTETKVREQYKGLLVNEKGEDRGALDPFVGKIRLIQISVEDNSLYKEDTVSIYLLDMDYLEKDNKSIELLKNWFNDKSKVAILHNAKFDIKMFWGSGYTLEWYLFDTRLACKVLHAGNKHFKEYTLAYLLSYYLDVDISKAQQKSDWSVDKLSSEQIKYAALDVYYLPRLRKILITHLTNAITIVDGVEKNLIQAAKIEFMTIKATAMMEYNGIKIDLNKWNKLIPFFEFKKEQAYDEVINKLPGSTYYFDVSGNKHYTLNLNSATQLLPIFHKLGIMDPRVEDEEFKGKLIQSTGKDVVGLLNLPEDQEHIQELIDSLIAYKKAEKMLTAFIYKMPLLLHPLTGRLHTTFWQHGADTSRFSSSNPNLQQIPSDYVDFSDYSLNPCTTIDEFRSTEINNILNVYRSQDGTFSVHAVNYKNKTEFIAKAETFQCELLTQANNLFDADEGNDIDKDLLKELLIKEVRPSVRECFVPSEEGYSIVVADFSQIEVRIVADEANEPIMIKAYRESRDIYKTTYSELNNTDYNSVTKDQRKSAKPQVLGLNYMMGALGFMRDVKKKYGMTLSLKEAKSIRKKYLNLYKGLSNWHDKYKKKAKHNCHKSSNRIGRYRVWLDEYNVSPNALCNYPIQSTSADITKVSASSVEKEVTKSPPITKTQDIYDKSNLPVPIGSFSYLTYTVRILLIVHDELVLECPTAIAPQVGAMLSNYMKKGGELFLDKVPVEAEATWGDSWAEKA